MQEGEKAACDELGSPEASRDHGRLPGGAGLAEWEGFAESREGRTREGRRHKGRSTKLLQGSEQAAESPFKNVIQFVIHSHRKTFSKGEEGCENTIKEGRP